MITLDDTNEPRARMPCGHIISTESMTEYLRSLIKDKKYRITCPG